MKHIRRVAVALSGLLATMLGFFVAGPVAFAVNVAPPEGQGAISTTSTIGGGSGLADWQVSIIGVGAAVFAALVTTLVLRLRFRAVLRSATA